MTEKSNLSYFDSHISTHAVWMDCVLFEWPLRKRSTLTFWSTVAVGEMSAVSSKSLRREVLPVPCEPAT